MIASILRVLAILGASTACGALAAKYHAFPWKPDVKQLEARDEFFAWLHKERSITLEQFRQALATGSVIIDARERSHFEQEHIRADIDVPTLNVPPEDTLDQHLGRLVQLQGYPLVLYCNSKDCDLAEDLVWELKQANVINPNDVSIFFPGWTVLGETDLPKTSGPDEWHGFQMAAPPSDDPNTGEADAVDDAGDVDTDEPTEP